MNWYFWRKKKTLLTLECQWAKLTHRRPWRYNEAGACAACGHLGCEHRDISVERKRNGSFDGYDTDWGCNKCGCKHYYRKDMHSLVTCKDCGVKYFACGAGNPDGMAFCPNGHLDNPFEPYCPGPGGAKYTPEQWDAMHKEED